MGKKFSDTKEVILKTSEQLFSKYGYDATSVDQIAKKAKIPKSLIYYYFKSKKEILENLFKAFEEELIKMKEKTFSNIFSKDKKEIKEKLKENLIAYTFPFLEKWKNIIKIALMEEIKSFAKGPIFKYFDINLSIAKELYNKNNLSIDFSEDKIASTFFNYFTTLIGYTLFVDEWCAHYNFDRDKVKELITNELVNHINNIIENSMVF